MEFDLGSSGYIEIQYNFTTSECCDILIALKQFHKEYDSKKYDFFSLDFINSIHKSGLINACNFFYELSKNNEILSNYLKIVDENNKDNEEQSSINFDILIDLEDHRKIIPSIISLQSLCMALRIQEYYFQENKSRKNNFINNSNDWAPPDNFQFGTDDEKEVWHSFIKS